MPDILTPDAVHELMIACLADDTPKESIHVVEGIMSNFGFNKDALLAHKSNIARLLAELPDNFFRKGGGGWSLLNLCEDRHGNPWTGSHATMESLCVLAIGADLGSWLMPRELWEVMPGGMPYVVFDLDKA